MKKSYVEEAENTVVTGSNAATDSTVPASKQEELPYVKDSTDQQNDGVTDILSQVELRASVLPLQVSLDDSENTPMESVLIANQNNGGEATETEKRKDRHMKKKEKQERWLMILIYLFFFI